MDNIIYKVNLKGTEYQIAATYDASNNNIEDTYLKKSEISQESTDEGITLNSVVLKEDQEKKTALITIPNATEEKSGVMSAKDKKKLNSIIPSSEIFYICTELPELEDATPGKIYCIKKTDSDTGFKKDEQNIFSEYIVLIEKSDNGETRRWEKIGTFNATPDLSGYAKLSGAVFTGGIRTNNVLETSVLFCHKISDLAGKYFPSGNLSDISDHKVYLTNGYLGDIGTTEDFVFTLEDGSTVTKSIRVISTTSQAGA